MLKKPLVPALCFCLLFAPVLAQAAPWKLAPRTESSLTVPRVLSVLAAWWSVFLGGEERTGSTTIQEKNGCGIDPNGQPLCGTGGGTAGAAAGGDPEAGG
jgi:hypothetical protein